MSQQPFFNTTLPAYPIFGPQYERAFRYEAASVASNDYLSVCLQFDKGLGLMFGLLIVNAVFQTRAGVGLPTNALGFLMPAYLIFGLTAIGFNRHQHDVRKSFLSGYRGLGIIFSAAAMTILFVSGIVIQGTLHRLVLSDVMDQESAFPLMIFIENTATLGAVPVWLWVSRRIGKHRALLAAALWLAILSLPLALLREGDVALLVILIAIRGSVTDGDCNPSRNVSSSSCRFFSCRNLKSSRLFQSNIRDFPDNFFFMVPPQ